MSDRTKHTGESFRRPVASDVDGMAVLGMTQHQRMGIRYHSGTPGTPTDPTPSPAPAPAPASGGPAPAPTPAPGPTPSNAPRQLPAPGPAPTDPPAPGTPPAPAPTNVPPAIAVNPRTNLPYTAEETQQRITDLNAESKTQREAREKAEGERDAAVTRANAILKAAGFNPDGTPYSEITPEVLQQTITTTTTTAENTARENLVLRTAPALSANADKLLDSRSFMDKLSALKSDDRAGVEALVTEFVSKDDSLKVTSAAASSGGVPHTGTTPPTSRKTREQALDAHFATTQRK